MKNKDKIEYIIKKQHGTIMSKDLDKYEIPRNYLQLMVKDGELEKVGTGIYVSRDSIGDEMFAMQSKYQKLIYSHETASYLHGLTDRTPFDYSVTVPSGYKVVSNLSSRFKIYYVKKEFHELGISDIESNFGNPLRVYDIERTICDILRSRNRIDIQITNEALKRYVNLKTADYSRLIQYAKKLKVERLVKHYLEVLL